MMPGGPRKISGFKSFGLEWTKRATCRALRGIRSGAQCRKKLRIAATMYLVVSIFAVKYDNGQPNK